MARPRHLELPGTVHRLTDRGNARQPIYLDDKDRVRFLGILANTVEHRCRRLHGYCLMTNDDLTRASS